MTRELLRVKAVNTAPDSENRMHDDTVARTYGFAGGGLVPGVDVFGYIVQGLLTDDPDWMRSGSGGELRLLRPYFDGEEVVVTRNGGEVWAGDRAVLRLAVPELGPCPAEWSALPEPRPAASQESLKPGTPLGSIQGAVKSARELLELANEILMRNVVLQPWIHTGSRILWLEGAQTAKEVEVRGYVSAEWERKGHRLVAVDLSYLETGGVQPVARIEHTAIWLYNRV